MGIIGMLNAGIDLALSNQVFAVTGGDTSLFTDLSYWINIIEDLNVVIQPLIGDAMLVYRMWVIYGRRWRTIIPFAFIWTGLMSVTTAFIILTIKSNLSGGLNGSNVTPFVAAALVLTVINNIMMTSLIAYRLWRITRELRPYIIGQHTLSSFMRIIIESGMLYTSTAIILLGATVSKNNFDFIAAGALVQVTGIAFNLIIIRVSSQKAIGDANVPVSIPHAFSLQTIRTSRAHGVSVECGVSPVQIHISQNTETNDEETMAVK
ncbi:hypothetical protein CERSUDRAFT_99162 [Gelatoporia subvermispora B]|uniref:Uncharacterized protein n=1 Tax=Ceriporiopsis subvermispora (strain B) TaxID=914234 RepID=M2QKX1_CERS8|nr:hypothetical protein CERSUDRAFT_99162 [Gelatoporia subvermispora B]